jgi:hypothetical protein
MASERRSLWALLRDRMRELPRAARVYVLFMLVTAFGIPLALLGALSGDGTMLIVGLVLAGLSVADSAIVLPIILARGSAGRGDE